MQSHDITLVSLDSLEHFVDGTGRATGSRIVRKESEEKGVDDLQMHACPHRSWAGNHIPRKQTQVQQRIFKDIY